MGSLRGGFLAGLTLLSLIGSSTAMKCYACVDQEVVEDKHHPKVPGLELPKCSDSHGEEFECEELIQHLGRLLGGLGGIADIPGKLLDLPGGAVDLAKGAVGGAVGLAKGVVGGAVGAASGVVGGAVGAASGVVGGAVGAATGAVGGAVGAAKGLLGGLGGLGGGLLGKKKGGDEGAGGSERRKRDSPDPVCIKQEFKKGEKSYVYKVCSPISDLHKYKLKDQEGDQCETADDVTSCACSTELCNKGYSLSFSHLVLGCLLLITLYWNNFGFA